MIQSSRKRKAGTDSNENTAKRLKSNSGDSVIAMTPHHTQKPVLPPESPANADDQRPHEEQHGNDASSNKGKSPTGGKPSQDRRIRKLVAPRPFPTVPRSVSATGPRSAHREGKNIICLTRKTPLGAYLRRCKDVIIKDGYKTLHLHAMGAAIPHLTLLLSGLPSILPFSAEEIHTELHTGTVEVQDEIIPDADDEDIDYRTRTKACLSCVIKIGDGEFDGDRTGPIKKSGVKTSGKTNRQKSKAKVISDGGARKVVFQEPEQEL